MYDQNCPQKDGFGACGVYCDKPKEVSIVAHYAKWHPCTCAPRQYEESPFDYAPHCSSCSCGKNKSPLEEKADAEPHTQFPGRDAHEDSIAQEEWVTEMAERIVIEYANITGRDETMRAYVRQASIAVLRNIISPAFHSLLAQARTEAIAEVKTIVCDNCKKLI